jgi:4-hydroxybenzoyl-CoA thioesterase
MGRVKLTLPETLPFTTRMEVRISDINYGGHLGNDAVLAYLDEARIRMLRSWGFTELDIEGVGIIMTDAEVVYRAEAFHGDELTLEVGVGALSSHGCEFLYRLRSSSSDREVARAKTGMAFFDYRTRTVAPVPPSFRRRAESVVPSPGA